MEGQIHFWLRMSAAAVILLNVAMYFSGWYKKNYLTRFAEILSCLVLAVISIIIHSYLVLFISCAFLLYELGSLSMEYLEDRYRIKKVNEALADPRLKVSFDEYLESIGNGLPVNHSDSPPDD